ncbi:MAG: D-alanyl-D-alanine carboxypeptidase/D-alanyl-D-alanine-endopeptidase [Acidobacteriota bacterium]
MHSLRVPLLVVLLLSPVPAAQAQEPIRGYLAMVGDQVVAARGEDMLFVPASVQKLVVAAACLHYLGPDYRIETPVLADGPVVDGALEGDLVVVAMADPSWSRRWSDNAPLDSLLPDLRRRGVRRVRGDLVLDVTRFPGRAAPVDRPLSESAFAFAAPTSALAVEENVLEVEIAPGPRPGEAGRITGPEGYRWINRIRTVGAERHGRGTVDFVPRWGTREVLVEGEYPVSEPAYTVQLAEPAPLLRAGEVLRSLLADGGIVVEGEVRTGSGVAPRTGRTLTVISSPPLRRLLEPVLSDSHNWYSDMLLRHLAVARSGEGRFAAGLGVLDEFWQEVLEVPAGSALGVDGSGLAKTTLVTPRAIVRLLAHAAGQPWFEHFRGALASPGEGTLEGWKGPRISAKTGTLRHTHGLAGYLPRSSSQPVIFAYFLNHHRAGKGSAWGEMGRALEDWRRQPTPKP